jgi:HAD superfamily hydrolase (TIGR01549 family)
MNKVVCFDLVWTLEDEADAQKDRAAQVVRLARGYGVPTSVAEIIEKQNHAGKIGIHSVFRYAVDNLGFPPALVGQIHREVVWNTAYLKLYPGTIELLSLLSKEYDLAIIANQSKPISDRLIRYGIFHFFKHIICSCEVGFDKPDPRIFELVVARCDVQDFEFWMIGDRIDNDIVPAKALGWKTIRLAQGDHKDYRPKCEEEIPDFERERICEIGAILDGRACV